MSMGPLGIVGSAAGSQLPQSKGTDADRASQDAADQSRKSEGANRAQAAEGVGQTDEQEQASDRDADGRRLWEQNEEAASEDQSGESGKGERGAAQSRDASGQSGNRLDLSG